MGYTGLPVPASPVWNGYLVAEEVINLANSRNITNYQMLLPPGNTTPVVPKRLIYVLNGA